MKKTIIPTDKIIFDEFSKLFFDRKKNVIPVIIIIENASTKNLGRNPINATLACVFLKL